MGEFSTIMARDGHEFQAYLSAAARAPGRGAVVVIQEIFGVNSQIRAVADRYAQAGYTCIAPALFDRVRRGIELGYSPESLQEGRGYVKQLQPKQTMEDVAAAIAVVRNSGRTAVVGYCWGGSIAYLAACDLPLACAVAYYGTGIASSLEKKPRHPMQFHFGERDAHIPPSDVARIAAANPEAEVYTYPADHAFANEQRSSYDPASAALAYERTLSFLSRHLAQERHAS